MSDAATENHLDNILAFMSLSDPKYKFEKMHRYPLSHFSPALVFATQDDEAIAESLDANVNTPEIFIDAEMEDVRDCKIDISILTAGSEKGVQYQVCRYRLLSAKEKRGLYFAGFPAVEAVYGHIHENGTFNTGKVMYVRRGQKWLVAPGRANPMAPLYIAENTQNVRCIFGVIFRQYFKWTVTLGYEGFPHISLTCTPEGAREVFRLSDLPEGKMRRSAIRHWVSEHSRRKKSDPNEFVKVLDYLRGETVFTWNGLRCSIKPSTSDINHYYKLHPDKQPKQIIHAIHQ